MVEKTGTVVSGEFDHTRGVYRLKVEIPINVVMAHEVGLRGSMPEIMHWIGELITNQANSLMEEEHNASFIDDPLSSIKK